MKILIIVPSYNEAPIITSTIDSILNHTQSLANRQILVIDDGSSDDTLKQLASSPVIILHHVINRGLGGSIGTGLEYAKRHNFDIAVTIDADGQHDPNDIHRIIKPLVTGLADVVIGTRLQSNDGTLPFDRKLLITLSNFLTYLLFGQKTSDSLSGFRGFSHQAIHSITLKTDRMEVSNELFSEIKRLKLSIAEVPIKIIYTSYSKAKGQKPANALNIFYKLLLRLFR